MGRFVNSTLKQLHDLEDKIIEINGLMKAVQGACDEDSVQICLTNVLAEKIQGLEKGFYAHWQSVVKG